MSVKTTPPGVENEGLYLMAKAHFNEPMISFGELVRCVGYAETAVDCYLIVRKKHGKLTWNTCVGGYIFLDRLKEQDCFRSDSGEDWNDLYRLNVELRQSGCPEEPSFLLDLRLDDWEGQRPRDRVSGAPV